MYDKSRYSKYLENRRKLGDKRIVAMIDGDTYEICKEWLTEFGSWRQLLNLLVNEHLAANGQERSQPLTIPNFMNIDPERTEIIPILKRDGYSFEDVLLHGLDLVREHGMTGYQR